MEHHPGAENGARPPERPSLRDMAWWLLRPGYGQDQSAELFIATAEEAYARLRARLVVSLGELGFNALWTRSLELALLQSARQDPSRELAVLTPGSSGISELNGHGDVQALHDVLHALFASFFSLLITFIGEELSFRIIHQLWPTLNQSTANPMHQKEHDHE